MSLSTVLLTFASPVVAMGAPPGGAAGLVQMLPFVVILGIMYFVLILPMRRKEQKSQQFRDGLKVNDRVITTSGIYGVITRLGDESVQLQIADKIRIEVARAAIGGYQGKPAVVEAAPQ